MYLHQAPRFHWGERYSQHPVPSKALVCLTDLLSQKETEGAATAVSSCWGDQQGSWRVWLHLHGYPRNRLFSLVLFPTQLLWGQLEQERVLAQV